MMNKTTISILVLFLFCKICYSQIPLPEHPRPDFERSQWQSLNGSWAFEFDQNDEGLSQNWAATNKKFTKNITVPFSWAAPLSGIAKDEADIAWYQKTINVPASWQEKRSFVTIGASDYETTVFLDGQRLGSHTGGYLPFSVELTKYLKYGSNQKLTIRVDDRRRDYALYGKQGYGDARGIWQTVYLEARGQNYIDQIRFDPDIDNQTVKLTVLTGENNFLTVAQPILVKINTPTGPISATASLKVGEREASVLIKIPNARLWQLHDPYLYTADISLGNTDALKSYFGMRKVSVTNLPGTQIPYIALNNKPVYMQLTLDQSYHPTGFYTFPSDAFMKNEIKLAKDLGLNGIRTHIKIDIPRKLYWADKLGLLVMADLPNFWGQPNAQARAESEATMPEMIKRDYNHPSIFSWILFNETWGLRSKIEENGKKVDRYLPETQAWVAEVYQKAKKLDPSRIIEDNSVCCGAGHTQTDLTSWHEYLPGSGWEAHLSKIEANSYPGSSYLYEPGYKQGNQPNINSECGNVWGYDGSTGDVDWSWDYHRMLNTFRVHPKVAGWLYTEHHDVINEWNGYWRFDRSMKYTGLAELLPGMTDADLHSEIYLSTGNNISEKVRPGQKVSIPLYLSSFTDKLPAQKLQLKVSLNGTDAIGQNKSWPGSSRTIDYQPYMNSYLDSLHITVPEQANVINVGLSLSTSTGIVLHHNLYHLIVQAAVNEQLVKIAGQQAKLLSQSPQQYSSANWSKKNWTVMDSMKVCGAGTGHFEYSFDLSKTKTKKVQFVAELAAKQLFAKDIDNSTLADQNYMLGAVVDPARNPNAYPMTDEARYPTELRILANGTLIKTITLPDDPADHRGILSWHNQLPDRKLRDAGSYGYPVLANIPAAVLAAALKTGKLKIKLEVSGKIAGGLAVYSQNFGRYGISPSLLMY
jgi:beta-galactosidase/beta-glucuronidase